MTPNARFESYVEHSYRYYQLDEPTVPDSYFDLLCLELAAVWDEVTHPDKHLTDRESLNAGTGFQMMFKWPAWVKARVNGEA
jgi:NAD-dependent DNA ligase